MENNPLYRRTLEFQMAEENLKSRSEVSSDASTLHLAKAARQFIAGGCAGLVEVSITHPLDVIKTRFQVQQGFTDPNRYTSVLNCATRMMRNEGSLSLYKGILPPVLIETPKRAVKFLTFETYRSFLSHCGINGPMSPLLCGAGAGVTEGFLVAPFERVKTSLQVQTARMSELPSAASCARSIVREHGFGREGLFKGLEVTLLRHGVGNGVFFGFYHNVKPLFMKNSEEPPVSIQLLVGLMTGTLATTCSLPFDVIKSRIQGHQPPDNPFKYHSTWRTGFTMYKEEGLRSLCKGWVPRIMRLGPGGAIILLIYEQVSRYLESVGL